MAGLLPRIPAAAQQSAAGNDRGQVGLAHQAAAQRLAKHHDIRGTATDTTLVLGKRHAEPAQVSELLPGGRVVPFFSFGQAAVALHVAMIGDKAADTVL